MDGTCGIRRRRVALDAIPAWFEAGMDPNGHVAKKSSLKKIPHWLGD